MKLVFQNKIQQTKDFEVVRANPRDNSITNNPQGMQGSQYCAGVVYWEAMRIVDI